MPLKLHHLFSTVFFLVATFCSTTIAAQDWRWVLNGEGDNQYGFADRDIAVDHVGTQFIAGYFTETLTLGAFTLVNPDDHYSDMYLAKIDSGGHVIWAQSIELGSSYHDYMGICLGDSNNIFLTGAATNGKIFVSKYDSSGALQWNSSLTSQSWYGYGTDIAVNQNDEVYISAKEYGNAFVAKLNYDGQLLWYNKIEGCNSNGALGTDLAVDRLGNCYMTGSYSCDSIIIGNYVVHKEYGYNATYIVKYTPDGKVSWAHGLGGIANTSERSQLAISALGDKILLAGGFGGDLKFDETHIVTPYMGSPSTYLAQYDTSGHVLWARNGSIYGGSTTDITMDYNNNIYACGINTGSSDNSFHWLQYNSAGDLVKSVGLLSGLVSGIDIDNNGNNYFIGHTNITGLGFFGPTYSRPYSVFVAKVAVGIPTPKRTGKPFINRLTTVCQGGSVPLLYAQGTDVKWYTDAPLTNLIATSNSYQPTITQTDTFYVTQTVNNITSWPKQVIVYFSTITPFQMVTQQDSLYAPKDSNYVYQWYRDSIPLADSVGGKLQGIRPATMGKYTVLVNDRGCVQQASTFFYFDKCPGGVDSFVSDISGFRYAWEVSANGGATYYPLINNGNYAGVTTPTLTIKNYPTAWRNYLYRCLVVEFYSNYSHTHQLLFQTKWTGAIDNNWGNAGNWSCGAVPDMYTDVLVGTGAVVIQSDAEARSVRLINEASVTVNEGAKLRVVK